MGRSHTGIISLLNNTTIEFYSKPKSCIKNTTYGSEYDAARIFNYQIVYLWNTLRYLGVPLHMVNGSDASFMFGNNVLVVNSTMMPAVKLQRLSHILNYHRTREAQAKGIVKFVHMNGNENPADILSKNFPSNTRFPLMKPCLFWNNMDFVKDKVVSKGSENSSSTPPLSQSKDTPQKSFKIDLWQILCE